MISLQETRMEAAWVHTLPNEWRLCRLKSVANIRYGLGQPPTELSSGVAMIRATDVDVGTIRTENLLRVDPQELPPGKDPYLKPWEIIVVRSGAYTGDSAIVPSALEGAVAGYDMVATVTRASSHFVAYSLLSKYVLEDQIHQLTLRAAQPHLNAEELGSVILAMPPTRHEQERIAAYLDASCAAIDAAVAAKRRQLETLDSLRKTIITRAVTRGIEDKAEIEPTGNVWMKSIPRGWSLVCLKRIADIQTGLTLGKIYEGPLIERPYLRVANVQDGHLDLEDISLIEVPAAVAARVELRAGDVLMTEGGDLDKLGRGYLWDGQIPNCLHQNHIFAVRCFPHKLRPMFLAYATASNHGRDYFEATGKRTTNLASTNSTKVGLFPIPVPPITEQERICDFLAAKLAEIKRIASGIESQIAMLTAYRKSLIHECVTGQRRVTDEDLRQMQQ
jgi:type I restriction enzyme S subunit